MNNARKMKTWENENDRQKQHEIIIQNNIENKIALPHD